MGCSPWGREESDTTERLHFHLEWILVDGWKSAEMDVLQVIFIANFLGNGNPRGNEAKTYCKKEGREIRSCACSSR